MIRCALIILVALGLTACDEDELLPFWIGKGDEKHSEVRVETIPTLPIPSQSLTLEDIDFASYSEGLAKFVGLKNGEESWVAIDKMRLYFAPEDGETILQTKTSTFDRPDGSVMIYTVSGLKDDSVKAQELFMIFQGPKGTQKLAAYGLKQKCQRGDDTTQWTTEFCP